MTNRLQKLRQEQERIKRALANDPRWVSMVGSLRTDGNGSRLSGLDPKTVSALAKHELFTAYVAVTRAIEELQAPELRAPAVSPFAATAEPAKPFRTRVTIKSSTKELGPAKDDARIDDLTAIRGIDRKTAAALSEQGVRTYQAIAEWDRHEVRRVRDALQLGKRIWRENWIEQAALLQLRKVDEPARMKAPSVSAPVVSGPETASTRNDASGDESSMESQAEQVPVVVDEPTTVLPVVAPTASDEPVAETGLPKKEANETDLPEPSEATDATESLVDQGSAAWGAEHVDPHGERDGSRLIKVGRRPQRLPAPAARRFVYLSGVSDEMAEALRSVGVKSLADIASWTRADVRWFQAILGDDARISHDQWIEQATLLSQGVWTAYALRVVRGETRSLVRRPVAEAFETIAAIAAPDGVKDDVVEDDGLVEQLQQGSQANAETAAPGKPDDVEVAATEADDDAGQPTLREQPFAIEAAQKATRGPREAVGPPKTEFAPLTMRAKLPPTARFDPMRGLSTAIALGKLKRPPPDLGEKKRAKKPAEEATSPVSLPEPAAGQAGESVDIILPVRLEPPPEAVDDIAVAQPSDVDDWDDAEALVVKRVPAAEQEKDESVGRTTRVGVPVIDEDDAPEHEDDWGDVVPWGGEADVVIVSKPRGEGDTQAKAPRSRPESATERARRKLGLTSSSETDATRNRVATGNQATDTTFGSYRDGAEEAMVTIIRAEASEENASSIVPNDIANDVSDPDQRQTSSGESTRPRVRVIGSRFLKALTGD